MVPKSYGFKFVLPKEKWDETGRVLKPTKRLDLKILNPSPNDEDAFTNVVYDLGIPAPKERTAWSIMNSLLQQQAFAYLRTELQLGYVAGAGVAKSISNAWSMQVYVQGAVKTPDEVEVAINQFIGIMTKYLAKMSQDEFNSWVGGYTSDISMRPASLDDVIQRDWREIIDGAMCFNRINAMRSYVPGITKQDLISAWDRMPTYFAIFWNICFIIAHFGYGLCRV